MSDETPRYTPDGYTNPMAAAQQKWLANKQDPAYSQTAKIIQHYYDKAMAGPTAMGRVAHGELDPMSPEGIRAAMAIAQSLPMQSPFVPRGSMGAGGGQMKQPPRYVPAPDLSPAQNAARAAEESYMSNYSNSLGAADEGMRRYFAPYLRGPDADKL